MKALKHFFKTIHFITISVFFCIVLSVLITRIAPHDSVPSGHAIASITQPKTSTNSADEQIINHIKKTTEEFLSSYTEISGELKPGDSLSTSFTRHNISAEIKNIIIEGFRNTIDFKQLYPGNTYTVYLDDDKQLVRCVFQSSPIDTYILERSEDEYVAKKTTVYLDRFTEYLSGSIETSLFESFLALGESPKLIYSFADIFSSKIDFNTETRKGDTFTALIEKYYKEGEFLGYGNILYAKYERFDHKETLEGYYYESDKVQGAYFDQDGNELGTYFIRSPVPFGRVSSRFSFQRMHPILGKIVPHLGVDLAAPHGTPIIAAADGRVKFKGINGGFGKQIILTHGNGYQTHYGHLSSFNKEVKAGQRVKQKQVIGYVGSTGLATGPHLDYRIQENGVFKNPFGIKFKPKSTLQGNDLANLISLQSRIAQYLDAVPFDTRIVDVREIVYTSKKNPVSLM
ncbi:MAG: M23 family metallopeptidase [Proteobacteria bacterium]|nr:M23 family metallopeptidase [Pseudomonadota bacterium]MBU1708831.1 M23 family metallopeptidase [Pseudomonadota bacterium]